MREKVRNENNKIIVPKAQRSKLEIKSLTNDLAFCLRALYFHSIITDNEYKRISDRYMKFGKEKNWV